MFALDITEYARQLWLGGTPEPRAARFLAKHTGMVEHCGGHLDSELTRSAFYGGRSYILQSGSFENVWRWDICSAYPWALSEMPSLKGANIAPILAQWGPLHIPLGYREADGSVSYPVTGTAYYWPYELEIRGRSFPWRWVRDLAEGPFPEEGREWLKQTLRCVWGNLLCPGFECYSVTLAGLVTALVDARLRALMADIGQENILLVNVDGLVTTSKKVPVRCSQFSEQFGEWKIKLQNIVIDGSRFGPGFGHPDPLKPGHWCPWWPTEDFRDVSVVGGAYRRGEAPVGFRYEELGNETEGP